MKLTRRITLVSIIACVLIIVLAIELVVKPSSPSPSFPPTIANAPQCSTSSNATLPCGFAGPYSSSIFVIVAANITASSSNNGSGTLTLTLAHSGNYQGTELGAVLWQPIGHNYTAILKTVATGQEKTYSAPVPASFGLESGQRYKLTLDSTTTGPPPESGITEELDIMLVAG